MCQLAPVPFHGDTIFCVEHDGQPYAPMKPIVENMGLAWQVQLRKLSENKERWGITKMVIPSDGGEQETICMPVRKLPAWLASINPKKVKLELRAKIELYQNECDDALWNYWANGMAARPDTQAEQSFELPADVPEYLHPVYKLHLQHLGNSQGRERFKKDEALRRRVYRKLRVSSLRLIKPEQVEDALKALARPVAAPTKRFYLDPGMPQEPKAPIIKGNWPSYRLAQMHAKISKNLRETAELIEKMADAWDACARPRGGVSSVAC